jgi:hypothetical protein
MIVTGIPNHKKKYPYVEFAKKLDMPSNPRYASFTSSTKSADNTNAKGSMTQT